MNKINEVLKKYTLGDELEISFNLPLGTDIQKFASAVVERYRPFSQERSKGKFVTVTVGDNKRVRENVATGSKEFLFKKKNHSATFSDGFKLKTATEKTIEPFGITPQDVKSRRTMQRLSIKIDTQWIMEISSVITEESTPGSVPTTTLELEMEYRGITPPSAESINERINDVRSLVTSMGIGLRVDFASKLAYVYSVYWGEDQRGFNPDQKGDGRDNRNTAPRGDGRDTAPRNRPVPPGIKGINNVITLKPHTWRELLADPTNIVITDKIDGTRKIVYGDSNFIYIMNNKNDFVYYNYPTGFEFIADAEEYVDPKTGVTTFFFFDIYKYRNVRYKYKTFTQRLDGITKVYEELKALDIKARSGGSPGLPISVSIKTFVELRGKYMELLEEFVKAPKRYVTDGFILINNKENISYKYKPDNTVDFYLQSVVDDAGGTNTNEYVLYCTMNEKFFKELSFPKEMLENVPVEYRPGGAGSGNASYTGSGNASYTGSGNASYTGSGNASYPIPFISSLDSSLEVSSYTFPSGAPREHHGKIAEFSWEGSYTKGGSWKFLKFREDRIVTSTYFGNHYKVAESNFSMDMINFDITEEVGGYFNTSNKKAQENVRRYTNLVMKQMLFDKIYGVLGCDGIANDDDNGITAVAVGDTTSTTGGIVTTNVTVLNMLKNPIKNIWNNNTEGTVATSDDDITPRGPQKKNRVDKSSFRLLDVSCGHGQDLNRYGDIELVLGLDIDKNAIIEMIDRRIDGSGIAGKSRKGPPQKQPLLLAGIADITEPAKKTFGLISTKHSIGKQYFSHAVCLLAFHYFCDNAISMNNALEFISGSLQSGGKFGMILYDGSKILDLMGDKKVTTKFPFGEEMCLKKNYKDYDRFGTKIGVRLPFSGDKFYDENIVVINDHLETFQKHGLYLDEVIPFEDHFNNDTYKITDIHDKNYLSLYHCVIFRKK